MTASMYCLYVGVDYTYIDINALAHAIKSQIWFQAVDGARTYDTDSPAGKPGSGYNVLMYNYIYVLFVGVDYTYIDINALAQAIKSHIWFQAVDGARTYDTDSPAGKPGSGYNVLMYDYIYVLFVCRG